MCLKFKNMSFYWLQQRSWRIYALGKDMKKFSRKLLSSLTWIDAHFETKPLFCAVLNTLTAFEPNTKLHSANFFSHRAAFFSCCKHSALKTVICNYTALNNGHISRTPHLQFCQKQGLPAHTVSDQIPAHPHPQLKEPAGQSSIMLT